MSALALRTSGLGARLLAHFDAQQTSADRLLELVLEQGRAIRAREVEAVMARVAQIRYEMERRGALERDRAVLLADAGAQLGLPAHAVTLEVLLPLLDEVSAAAARTRSAHLRGTLEEIGTHHQRNKLLMRQELAFLDHLTRMLLSAPADEAGYSRPSAGPRASAWSPSGLAGLNLTA